MAGTLEISENRTWMPAGWAFDGVMRLMAAELRRDDVSLADILLRAQTEVSGGYCDLRRLDVGRFRLLVGAAQRAYERIEYGGPGDFYDPSFHSAFLEAFREFKAHLLADPRARGSAQP